MAHVFGLVSLSQLKFLYHQVEIEYGESQGHPGKKLANSFFRELTTVSSIHGTHYTKASSTHEKKLTCPNFLLPYALAISRTNFEVEVPNLG